MRHVFAAGEPHQLYLRPVAIARVLYAKRREQLDCIFFLFRVRLYLEIQLVIGIDSFYLRARIGRLSVEIPVEEPRNVRERFDYAVVERAFDYAERLYRRGVADKLGHFVERAVLGVGRYRHIQRYCRYRRVSVVVERGAVVD